MKFNRTLLTMFSFITIIAFSGFTFFQTRSYYVDSDTGATRGTYPDNRFFRHEGDFYSLHLNYPEDMYDPILGQEVFLKLGGCTHFISFFVRQKGDSPVRYRIKHFSLKDEQGQIIPGLMNQMNMYQDFMWKAAEHEEKPTVKMIPGVLKQITRDAPNVDFYYESNLDELYFGYEFRKPPQRVILEYEIEIYTLDLSKREVITDSLTLDRVLGHSDEWLKIDRNIGVSTFIQKILLFPIALPSALIYGFVLWYADRPPKDKPSISLNVAIGNLNKAGTLSLSELNTTLIVLNRSKNPTLIPYWVMLGKKALQQESDRMRDYYFENAIRALSRYYGDNQALRAIEELEKELFSTSASKTKMMFISMLMTKKNTLNPPYRFVNSEVLANSQNLMMKYKEVGELLREVTADKDLLKQGHALIQKGLYEKALAVYREALNGKFVFTDNERVDAKRYIVKTLVLLGRYEEAFEEQRWLIERIIKNKPSADLKIQRLEALIAYKKTGDPSKVYQYLERAKTEIHFKDFYNAEALFLYGVIGDSEKGIALVDEMIGPLKSVSELSQVKSENRRSFEAKEKLKKYYLLREAFLKSRTENKTMEISKLVANLSEYYLL